MVKYDHITSASNGQTGQSNKRPSEVVFSGMKRRMYVLVVVLLIMIVALIVNALGESSEAAETLFVLGFGFILGAYLMWRGEPSLEVVWAMEAIEKEHGTLANDADKRRVAAQINAGAVYLIQDTDVTGFYKIGKTNKPTDRIGHFDTMLPFSVRVVHIIPSKDCSTLETVLHRHFASKRVRGEWFRLTDADVQWIKRMEKV